MNSRMVPIAAKMIIPIPAVTLLKSLWFLRELMALNLEGFIRLVINNLTIVMVVMVVMVNCSLNGGVSKVIINCSRPLVNQN